MAQIPRPPKQGSVTTYVAKVAAGYSRILAGEMDADLDTIYGAWNGGADTVNLRDGCVTSAKIAADAVGPRELADGGIFTVALADGCVTTPKLADGAVTDVKVSNVAWGKVTGAPPAFVGTAAGGDLQGSYPNPGIRDGAVTAAKLAAGAVSGGTLAADSVGAAALADNAVDTNAIVDLAVTRAKLALGATVGVWGTQTRATTLPLSVGVEGVYLDFTWVSRGAAYFVLASLHCAVSVDSVTTPAVGVTIRLRLDGTAATADGTILQEQTLTDIGSGGPTIVEAPTTLTAMGASLGIAAGTHRIKVGVLPVNRIPGWTRVLSGWAILVESA